MEIGISSLKIMGKSQNEIYPIFNIPSNLGRNQKQKEAPHLKYRGQCQFLET